MHLHILGICGTFMGGIAAIARQAGYTVTGCDANVYPPMSTQLQTLGIELTAGYAAAQVDGVAKDADVFVERLKVEDGYLGIDCSDFDAHRLEHLFRFDNRARD